MNKMRRLTSDWQDMNLETRIICHIICGNRNEDGYCRATTIHLHGCSPDADNVVACSEFREAKAGKKTK